MVVTWRHKFVEALAILFIAPGVFASEIPTVEGWLKSPSLAKSKFIARDSFPNVLFVSGWQKNFRPLMFGISTDEFNGGGYLRYPRSSDVDWAFDLNSWPGGSTPSISEPGQRAAAAMGIARLDVLVVGDWKASKDWKVYVKNAKSGISSAQFGAPRSEDAADLKAWLATALGYNAIVIASQGEYSLIARMFADFNGDNVQGLTVKNSASSAFVKESGSKGSGLLSYVSGKGPLAVFRAVVMEKGMTTVPVGAKVILDK
jgi:hypothetical protein